MRTAGSRTPVLNFPTPTVGIPKAVVKAARDFDEVAARYARTAREVKDSDGAVAAAQALDQSEYIERLRKDDNAVPARNHESDALIEQAAAQRKLEALSTLVDEAGDALARTIGDHRSGWLDELREAEARAAATYEAQVAEIESTLAGLVELRAGLQWLEKYQTGAAITFDMNRLDVRYRVGGTPHLFMKINGNWDKVRGISIVPVPALVSALRSAVEEPEELKAVTNEPAKVVETSLGRA